MSTPPPARRPESPADSELFDESRPPRDRRASLGRLLSLARVEWKLIAGGMVFLSIGSLLTLQVPQQMGKVVDSSLRSGDHGSINRLVLVILGLALVNGAAMSARHMMFAISGERIVARVRTLLFERILAQEIGFFDRRRTGELTSRLSSDTVMIQNAVSVNVSMGLRNITMALGALGYATFMSPSLTAVMMSVVPPIAVASVVYGRRIRKLSQKVQDALAEASQVAEESVSGIRTVRSFAAEPKEAARYGATIERSFRLAVRRSWAGAMFMAATSTAGFVAVALVLWYGAGLIDGGQMSAGRLMSFLIYAMLIGVSLGSLADTWVDFMRSLGATERVFGLIDRVPAIPLEGGRTLAHPTGRVVFDQVGFAYPSRPDIQVLDGVALEMAPGEVVAVVGPSGAGKSTLSSLLARFYDPQAGRVLLDGEDLRELDPGWLRRRIGTVAQEPILFATSVAENIRYGRPEASDAEVEAAARAANAHDFIVRFPEGYATLVGERGVQLSGGQKQRVAIARAVLKDPLLLILDEATSALDAESEHLVKEALERLMRGRTTLIIAHRLSTVMGADRVLVLDGGRIVQAGSHRALMAEEGLYRRLVERQFVAA